MPQPDFQFRLRKDPTTYYYINGSGSLATSTTAKNLNASVVDWATFQMQWKRHPVYQGVFRAFSPDTVRFAEDGARILRQVYNTLGGREAVCFLEVMKLKSSDQQYYTRCICAIDFSKYSSEETTVSVKLIEGGLSARLQAYDSTDFEIPIGKPGVDPDAEYLWMDGVNLLGTYNYQSQINAAHLLAVFDSSNFGAGDLDQKTVGIVFVEQEGAYPVGVAQSVLPGVVVPQGFFDNANVFRVLNTDYIGTLKLKLDFFRIKNNSGSLRDMKLSLWANIYGPDGWNDLQDSVMLWEDPAGFLPPNTTSPTTTASTDTLFPNGWQYTHPKNSRLVLYFRAEVDTPITVFGDSATMSVQLTSSATPITMDYQYIQPTTTCRAIRHWQLFRKLSHALTETTVDPISDILTTDIAPGTYPIYYNLNPANTFMTCGDALRQLDKSADGSPSDPSIKTNITDFTNDAFTSLCAGVGIEQDGLGNEVLRLEHLSYFYQKNTVIANLGSKITNFKMYPYNEYVGNNIKFGTKAQTYNDTNGRYEYNSEMNFQTPITRVLKDINYATDYRDGCYNAEFVRANLASKKTTDASSDNETFKIQSTGNDYSGSGVVPYPYIIERANGIISGLPVEVRTTVFNVAHTPGRKAGRMKPWLKANYADLTTPKLIFKTGSKNKDLVAEMVTTPGLVVTEAADQDLTPDGTGDDLLYKPIVFDFTAEVPLDMLDAITANPYGVFELENLGVPLAGFNLECGITDGTNDVYNFKLLCSPDTVIPAWM